MEAKKKYSIQNFRFISRLGSGSYGTVVKAEKIDTNECYAIKIVDKSLLKKENKTKQAHTEKNILAKLKNHPGIVRLHFTFQDHDSLYFVLDYCPNGELLGLIKCLGSAFSSDLVRFYAAQLVNIIEYMHSHKVIHRDLKPENLLLSENYHLKLIDFGAAKDMSEEAKTNKGSRSTFVGTAEYVSPEVLADGDVGPGADLWALGCIIYHMYAGRSPFRAPSEAMIFERINEGIVEYPREMPDLAVDLIIKLLIRDPKHRLGAGEMGTVTDFRALKAHPYFEGLDIDTIFEQTAPSFSKPSEYVQEQAEDIEIAILNRKSDLHTVVSGVVKKKAGWIYKKRLLLITNEPRISYYDPTKNEYKGDVEISRDLFGSVKSNKEFHLITPKRTYYFKTLRGSPDTWVDAVNKLVADKYRNE